MTIIPFDQRDGFIWFNGKTVPWKDAKVHVLTHGLGWNISMFWKVKLRINIQKLIGPITITVFCIVVVKFEMIGLNGLGEGWVGL